MNPDDAEHRFRLTLQYDGSRFLGWQRQASGRTVQGEVEAALERITGAHRSVAASGRTDRGVHATGQVAAVTLPGRWQAQELERALNALLPEDVWLESAQLVDLGFHPRYDARARTYRYQLGLHPASASPFHRPYCWSLVRPMDVTLLQRAAALLPGTRSFRSFAKSGQEERGDQCTVMQVAWVRWGDLGVALQITADRFLHHMVRYLVGTMVDVGRGRRPLDELRELLTEPDTGLDTSPPAPPSGLFLSRVHYTGGDS